MSYQNPGTYCENCDSRTWRVMGDCAGCSAPVCDECSAVRDVERNGRYVRADLYCSACVQQHLEVEVYCTECGCNRHMATEEGITCCSLAVAHTAAPAVKIAA